MLHQSEPSIQSLHARAYTPSTATTPSTTPRRPSHGPTNKPSCRQDSKHHKKPMTASESTTTRATSLLQRDSLLRAVFVQVTASYEPSHIDPHIDCTQQQAKLRASRRSTPASTAFYGCWINAKGLRVAKRGAVDARIDAGEPDRGSEGNFGRIQ
jgi:hypothetical protein